MGVYYERKEPVASRGRCYGCRHGQCCNGTGDLEPTPGSWPGFVCTCTCRPSANSVASNGAREQDGPTAVDRRSNPMPDREPG